MVSVVSALLSAFAILFIGKTGLRRRVVERAPKLISGAFGCDFCLSFWTNLFVCLLLSVIFGEWGIIALPFFLAPVTRKFIE